MRTLESALRSWDDTVAEATILEQCKSHIYGTQDSGLLSNRSIYWKAFLLYSDCNHQTWMTRAHSARRAYSDLKDRYLTQSHLEHADPLSAAAETSWKTVNEEEALRTEIIQDVDRCMPGHDLFRQSDIRQMLIDILFVYCKLRPDLGYRQGMHELLAMLILAVHVDAIDHVSLDAPPSIVTTLCDSRYIEHDTFELFCSLMQSASSFYETVAYDAVQISTTNHSHQSPMMQRIQRIYHDILPRLDPQLYAHLQDIDVLPQIFLLRWIRLLFGREFALADVLAIWDVIFAYDKSLLLVDYVCLTLLLYLRWDLLAADYNVALMLLLKVPALQGEITPKRLATDAIRLREQPENTLAETLISEYSGKAPAAIQLDTSHLTPHADRSLPSKFPFSPPRLSPRFAENLENILQDAAKTVYTKSESLGINSAVRDVVKDIRKGVSDLSVQNSPRSTPSRHIQPTQSDSSQRNSDIAKMLQTAIDQLWSVHEVVAASKTADKGIIAKFSEAIAMVQFAQVYLEDPTMPIATHDSGRRRDRSQSQEPLVTKMSSQSDATYPRTITSEEHYGDSPSIEVGAPDRSAQSTISNSTPYQARNDMADNGAVKHGFAASADNSGLANDSPLEPSTRRARLDISMFGESANKSSSALPSTSSLFSQSDQDFDIKSLGKAKHRA